MPDWTPEPWKVGPYPEFSHNKVVCITNTETYVFSDTAIGEDEDQANAERIVACVNACAGISTEALEQGVVKELYEQLLCCKAALEWKSVVHALGANDWDHLYQRVCAALKKAKGEQP